MISIIIPVYNVEKFLPECLDSLLSQTYTDFEVILVDDGSPDKSGSICDEYTQKDARIRAIHQKNAGVSAARNNGIEQARGEWVTFIDSDDWVCSNYLQNFHLDESDGIDLVIQGLEYYDQRDGHFFSPWSFKECVLKKDDFLFAFAENKLMEVGFPVGKAYSKKLLDLNNLRFDTRLSFHEDHIFVLDYYMLCHTIRLVDAIDYKYRYYHTGASLSSKRHPWDKMNLAGDEMLKRFFLMQGVYFPKDSAEANKLYDFAYSCKVTAANTIILSNMPYKEKRKAYRQVIKREEIRRYSHPESMRAIIDTLIYSYMPFFLGYTYNHLIDLLGKIKR